MPEFPGVSAADAAWPEVAARLSGGARAVLPIGAGTKEHGRHLPLGTDWLQAEWLVQGLIERAPVVVWPTVTYGYYPAFTDYPGSCSLSRATFQALIKEILEAIVDAGAQRIVILNTGVSTIAPLEDVVAAMTGRAAVVLAHVYEGPCYREAAARVEQQPRGGHADELETSIMLAIAPGQVSMGLAAPWAAREIRGPFNRSQSDAPNYSPDGVYGDPTLASADKGRRLLAAMLDDVLAVVRGPPDVP